MGIFDKPVRRDTAANSTDEIRRRLALVGYFAALLFSPVLGLAAFAKRDPVLLGGTIACAVVFVVLHVTRRHWKDAGPPSRPTASAPAQPVDVPAPAAPLSTGGSSDRRPRLVILNAALAGASGNTAQLLSKARELLAPAADVTVITLAENQGAGGVVFENVRQTLARADGFVIGTGTHWDSWSSVLQRFLEEATDAEGTDLWLGKPAACVVTEHSVGGKGVLSRLQGVLVTLGCTLPPMSGLVVSRAAHVAGRHDADAARDFWCTGDLAIVCHNLLEAVNGTRHWQSWPVDRTDFRARWL